MNSKMGLVMKEESCMFHKFLLAGMILIFWMSFGLERVFASTCRPTTSVQESYDSANVVIIAKAVSLDKGFENETSQTSETKTIKMVIEKVYKGRLKAGQEIVFNSGGGFFIWSFDERNVGKQYLLYLRAEVINPKIWDVEGCRRSTDLKDANDDLLYLNKMSKMLGKRRISGTVHFQSDTDSNPKGINIQIIGEDKTYEIKTDEHGVYEIYDLPAGKYLIKPEAPTGWTVNSYFPTTFTSFAGKSDFKFEIQKGIPIILLAKKQAAMDITFEINSAVRGKVVDPAGQPMKRVCLSAIPLQSKNLTDYGSHCTNENGDFSIERLSPGLYELVANAEGTISSEQPFKTLYYPGVSQLELAVPVKISIGEFRENLFFHVPKIEERVTVEGVLVNADGQPVSGRIQYFPANETRRFSRGVDSHSDSQGNFLFKILKGEKGELVGSKLIIAQDSICETLETLAGGTRRRVEQPKSQIVQINADKNISGIILKLSVPTCKLIEEK